MLGAQDQGGAAAKGAVSMAGPAAEAGVRTTVLPSGHALHSYLTRAAVPMEAGRRLLRAHAEMMHGRMVGCGGPDFDVTLHLNAFWSKFESVLPPNGAYYLATDPQGAYVGTGALRVLNATTAEMKHLYVAPEARGAGLGRALVLARMADARAMGLRTLVADTFSANTEMPALYAKLGFREVAPSADSATAQTSPELVAFMTFYRYDLGS